MIPPGSSASRVGKPRLTDGQSFFLNAVRYVAAAMVVLYHNLCFLFNVSHHSYYTGLYIPHLGFAGVSIFFILSGFVIAYTVSRKTSGPGDYSLKTYLIERFSRIWIVLLPVVAITALVDVLVIERHFPGIDTRTAPINIFATLFLVNNFRPFGSGTGVAPVIFNLIPIWSLEYEVSFYLLFGLVALAFRSRSHRAAKIVAVAAALLFVSRYPLAVRMSYNWLLGVLGAHLFARAINLGRAARLVILAAVVLAAAGIYTLAGELTTAQREWVAISLLAAVFCALFVASETLAIGPRLGAAAKFLASYSYSMYLLHYMLLYLAYNILFDAQAVYARGPVATVLLVLFLFVAVNALSYLFSLATERNTARLRKFLLGARGTAGAVPG